MGVDPEKTTRVHVHLVSSTVLFLLASLQVALLVATMSYGLAPNGGDYVELENAIVAMQTTFNAIILLSL
jgi:hypothetical protein